MIEERLIERVNVLVHDFKYDKSFSNYLKEYFRRNPKAGSRDRRMTREWCYNFFRIGKNLESIPFAEKLGVACFLCNNESNTFLEYLFQKNGFDTKDLKSTLDEKIKIVSEKFPDFGMEKVFPMHDELSVEIERKEWFESFLKKPLVWIRIRERYVNKVHEEFINRGIRFYESGQSLIYSFEPDVPLEKTESFMKGYFEIQDNNSQRTADYFYSEGDEFWWDACAGSGGKSLLLMEKNPFVRIFATDSRKNILENYSTRMRKAGHNSFQTQHFDFSLSKTLIAPFKPGNTSFDGIIADVPCTGSGTWSRTPEWNQKDHKRRVIDHFIPLQRKIVTDAVQFLNPGRPLIFITCSAFAKENEENVAYFIGQLPVKLEKYAYLKGYNNRSDTLFIARFIRK